MPVEAEVEMTKLTDRSEGQAELAEAEKGATEYPLELFFIEAWG